MQQLLDRLHGLEIRQSCPSVSVDQQVMSIAA
jgi:hypothetical protein